MELQGFSDGFYITSLNYSDSELDSAEGFYIYEETIMDTGILSKNDLIESLKNNYPLFFAEKDGDSWIIINRIILLNSNNQIIIT